MTAVRTKLARRSPVVKPSATTGPPPWHGAHHLRRRVAQLLVLVMADSLLLLLFGYEISGIRRQSWVPTAWQDALDGLLPVGSGHITEITIAVLLSLLVLKAYALAERGPLERRRVMAAALGVAIPTWSTLWIGQGLDLAMYGMLSAILALFLILESRMVESLLQMATPKASRATRVLLVASKHDIRRARRRFDQTVFTVEAIFDPKRLQSDRALEEFCEAMRHCGAKTILLCCGSLGNRAFNVVLDGAATTGAQLVSLARSFGGAGSEPRIRWIRGVPLLTLADPVVRTFELAVKRMVDVTGACLGLLILAPLILVIAMAVTLQSPGPILFGHRRLGAGGRPFRCLKFRSMRIDAEELLQKNPALLSEYIKNNFKLPERSDPRITRLGRLLRATSLDELPQLWNVLRGDMSLVGPRPVVHDELTHYGDSSRLLLSLRPGLAGAWAVNGRSRVGYPQRADMELAYVRRWRLPVDAGILARAVPAVISQRGAH